MDIEQIIETIEEMDEFYKKHGWTLMPKDIIEMLKKELKP